MEISLNNVINDVISTAGSELLEAEKVQLLDEIKVVKCEMQNAYINFDYADDSLMVDYYTYQIKAYEAKFQYLIKKAKEIGLTCV